MKQQDTSIYSFYLGGGVSDWTKKEIIGLRNNPQMRET